MHDATRGSDTREARTLDGPALKFDLDEELADLRTEPGLETSGRATKTLAKNDHLRLVLTFARNGSVMGEYDAEEAVAVKVLDGRVQIDRGGARVPLDSGGLIWLGAGPTWKLTADGDTCALLVIGWPGGNGGPPPASLC